ncbi:MAG: hypothetical protein ACSHX6_06410 [Akkermansiaceae bacterium]
MHFSMVWSMAFQAMWYAQIINNTTCGIGGGMQKMTFYTCEMADAYKKAKLRSFPTENNS